MVNSLANDESVDLNFKEFVENILNAAIVFTGHVLRRLDLSNMTHYPSPYAMEK